MKHLKGNYQLVVLPVHNAAINTQNIDTYIGTFMHPSKRD